MAMAALNCTCLGMRVVRTSVVTANEMMCADSRQVLRRTHSLYVRHWLPVSACGHTVDTARTMPYRI